MPIIGDFPIGDITAETTTTAIVHPAPYPILLIDILTTTPQYISSKNIFVDGNEYRRRLTKDNSTRIQKELTDAQGNQKWPVDIELKISNILGYVTQLNVIQELRGVPVKIRSYNITTSTALFEYRGFITEKFLGDTATLTVSVQDPFKTLLPLRVLNNDDFASDRTVSAYRPSRDLGKAIPLPLGHVVKSPLIAVYNDMTNNHYDYLIGYAGANGIESNNSNKGTTVTIRRKKAIVTNTEYTVYDGTQSSPYAGFAFVRFIKMQIDGSGNFYDLDISCHGIKMGGSTAERNPIRQIQGILSNAWGLSQSVNTASFNTAATIQIGQQGATPIYMSDLKSDNSVTERTEALDILTHLQSLARTHLYKNEAGEWCVQVDVYNATDSATFGDRDTHWKNIFKIGELQYQSSHDAMKSISIHYRLNPWTNEYAQQTEPRPVFSFGQDIVIENPFIREHETADIHACYLALKALYADETLPITVGREGSTLNEGDVVAVKVPRPAYNIDSRYKVISANKSAMKQQFDLVLEKHTYIMYEYIPIGTLPSDENDDSVFDYATTSPSTPANFTKIDQGVNLSEDGSGTAWFKVQADNTDDHNFARMLFGFRKQDDTLPFSLFQGNLVSGDTWETRLDGLIPGLLYQLCAIAENAFGMQSIPVLLNNQLAPGDITPPAVPSGLTTSVNGWLITATVNKQTEADFGGFEFHASTVSGFTPSDSTLKQRGNSNVCPFVGTADLQTWYIKVRSYDLTPNYSVYCTQGSAITESKEGGDTTPPDTPTGLTLTTGMSKDDDGSNYCWILAQWTANPEGDMSYYEWRIKEWGEDPYGNYIYGYVGTNSRLFKPVRSNVIYYVSVRAIDGDGNKSGFCAEASITSASDSTPLAVPSNVEATAGIQYILITWDAIIDKNLGSYLVYRNTVNNSATAIQIADRKDNYFIDGGLPIQPFYYWVKSKNTSGYLSAFSAVASATPRNVQTADVEVIAATKILIDGVVYLTNWRKTGDLTRIDGGQISTSSILAKQIVIQDGNSLQNLDAWASNPAARINTQTTTILPGKILVSGAITLSDWRHGSDLTKIDGGDVYANSLTANKIAVGSRNVTFDGLSFSVNKTTNVVSWSAGTVSYVNDSGTVTSRSIPAGNQTCSSGTYYFYWVKDASSLSVTTTRSTAFGAENLVIAVYVVSTKALLVFYARTIIDGSDITAGTITGDRIVASGISADLITAGVIKILDGSICRSSYGGTRLGVRDGKTYFYNATNNVICEIGDSAYAVQRIVNYDKNCGLSIDSANGGILMAVGNNFAGIDIYHAANSSDASGIAISTPQNTPAIYLTNNTDNAIMALKVALVGGIRRLMGNRLMGAGWEIMW